MERKEKMGMKIRKLIWEGDVVRVSVLYQLATVVVSKYHHCGCL
jgi:hypothetical protein